MEQLSAHTVVMLSTRSLTPALVLSFHRGLHNASCCYTSGVMRRGGRRGESSVMVVHLSNKLSTDDTHGQRWLPLSTHGPKIWTCLFIFTSLFVAACTQTHTYQATKAPCVCMYMWVCATVLCVTDHWLLLLAAPTHSPHPANVLVQNQQQYALTPSLSPKCDSQHAALTDQPAIVSTCSVDKVTRFSKILT